MCSVLVTLTSCSIKNIEVYLFNSVRIYPKIEQKSPDKFEKLGAPVKSYKDPNHETPEYMHGINSHLEKIINPDYIPPIPLINIQDKF